MSNKNLKNRSSFASTLDNDLYRQFDELHKKTHIPKSRLFDEAIKDLLKKYDNKVNSQKSY